MSLVIDLFSGGGGTSLGVEMAIGRSPDVAVNHSAEALAMHAANHPNTKHLCGNVWDYAPKEVTGGRPVDLLWASPDCKHFSKAKGGKPKNGKIRSLAWVAVRWAREVKPLVISKSTAQNALNLVRVVLEDAVEAGHLELNPARDVRLPTAIRKRRRTTKGWTYLLPAEQAALVTAEKIPLRERLAIAFALGTGARQDEQWTIELRDLDLKTGVVTLRHTKNGKPRTVPLLPIARAAAVRWLELRRDEAVYRKGRRCELLWCTIRGHRRRHDHRDWQTWTEEVLGSASRHDGRHVRWHDLRHTCATSLVQGWWGRAWSLQEVQVMLDHESITTTERYAHLDGGVAVTAARLTSESPGPYLEIGQKGLAPPARIELATFGLGILREGEPTREVEPDPGETLVRPLARAVRELSAGWDALERMLAEDAS